MPNLPSFEKPPIDELVLSIQFATLQRFTSAHVGMFWDQIEDIFPQVSEQPPIQPVFETFGGLRTAHPGIHFEALAGLPMPRYWFESPGQPDLLQLQRDRLLRNWRQAPDGSRVYPRYEFVRDAFKGDVVRFQEWLKHKELGEVIPNQCEVTYINLLRLPDGSDPHKQPHRISNVWPVNLKLPTSQKVEHSNVQIVSIFELAGKPAGRTYTTFQPALVNATAEPIIRLEITVRGKPLGEGVEAAFTFLDIARAEVVNTFTSITTPEMHKFWGRTDG